MKKKLSYLLLAPVFALIGILGIAPATQADALTCNMQSYSGADDTGYRMDIPFSLYLGSQDYSNVYVTTNGTMTFGQLDATFHDYPQTPSVSVAGWDWVTWGEGAYVSYGYNSNSFCIEWSVRPFPQSSGNLTQIRLLVTKFPSGAWHGEITTFGWLPDNLRRAIRFEQGQPVVTMAAAFDVNGGVPVEVTPAPQPSSFTEPPVPPTECWDGSVVYAPVTCPVEPSYTCWDGQITHYASECSTEPVVVCWDGSTVHYESECSLAPPDIVCWDGQVVPWNGQCRQVPPPVECWDGTSVNWDQQCPVRPNPTEQENVVFGTANEGWNLTLSAPPGMKFNSVVFASYGTPNNYVIGQCHASNSVQIIEQMIINTNTITISANNSVFGDPCGGTYKRLSVVLGYEIDQTWTPSPSPVPSESVSPSESAVPTSEPTPTMSPETQSPSPEPTVEPSPTLSPTTEPSLDPTPEPSVLPSVAPEPSSLPTILESPEPFPSLPPVDNGTTEEVIEPFVVLENGVVLEADVAEALELFDNPEALLIAIIADPGKAIKAFLNVGADMTPEQRDESQKVIVAAVIAGQLMNALSAANNIGRKL